MLLTKDEGKRVWQGSGSIEEEMELRYSDEDEEGADGGSQFLLHCSPEGDKGEAD